MTLDGAHDNSDEYFQSDYNEYSQGDCNKSTTSECAADSHMELDDPHDESPPSECVLDVHEVLEGTHDESESKSRDSTAESHMGLVGTYDDGGYYQGLFDRLHYGVPRPRPGIPSNYFPEHDLPFPFEGKIFDVARSLKPSDDSFLYKDGHDYILEVAQWLREIRDFYLPQYQGDRNYIYDRPSNARMHHPSDGQYARRDTPRHVPAGNNMSGAYARVKVESYRPNEARRSIRHAQVLTETLQRHSYSSTRAADVVQPDVREAEVDHTAWRGDCYRPDYNGRTRTPTLDYD